MSYDLAGTDRDLLQQAIDATVGTVGAARISRRNEGPGRSHTKPGPPILLGLGKITATGADGAHWKWSLSLRHAADGTFTSETTPSSDNYGECVIANAGRGGVGSDRVVCI